MADTVKNVEQIIETLINFKDYKTLIGLVSLRRFKIEDSTLQKYPVLKSIKCLLSAQVIIVFKLVELGYLKIEDKNIENIYLLLKKIKDPSILVGVAENLYNNTGLTRKGHFPKSFEALLSLLNENGIN